MWKDVSERNRVISFEPIGKRLYPKSFRELRMLSVKINIDTFWRTEKKICQWQFEWKRQWLKIIWLETIDRLWIGLEDTEVESMFRWTDGYLVTWVNWHGGRALGDSRDGPQIRDCVYRLSGSTGKWVDGDCTDNRAYYCETVTRKLFSIHKLLTV